MRQTASERSEGAHPLGRASRRARRPAIRDRGGRCPVGGGGREERSLNTVGRALSKSAKHRRSGSVRMRNSPRGNDPGVCAIRQRKQQHREECGNGIEDLERWVEAAKTRGWWPGQKQCGASKLTSERVHDAPERECGDGETNCQNNDRSRSAGQPGVRPPRTGSIGRRKSIHDVARSTGRSDRLHCDLRSRKLLGLHKRRNGAANT